MQDVINPKPDCQRLWTFFMHIFCTQINLSLFAFLGSLLIEMKCAWVGLTDVLLPVAGNLAVDLFCAAVTCGLPQAFSTVPLFRHTLPKLGFCEWALRGGSGPVMLSACREPETLHTTVTCRPTTNKPVCVWRHSFCGAKKLKIKINLSWY